MKNGFTLIELLVVVLIIGILAGIALPQYFFAVEKTRAQEGVAISKVVGDAMAVYYLTNGRSTGSLNDLVFTVENNKFFSISLGTDGNNFYSQVPRLTGDYQFLQFVVSANPLFKGRIMCVWNNDRGRRLCQTIGSADSCSYYTNPCTFIK